MIRLLWLSTKVLFLVYGKQQEQSIPKAFKLTFMPAKHTSKVTWLEDLTTKMYVDCLPNFVSGLHVNRLLEFPKLTSITGEAQARTVVDALEEWGISRKEEELSFDTMATNTAMSIEMGHDCV